MSLHVLMIERCMDTLLYDRGNTPDMRIGRKRARDACNHHLVAAESLRGVERLVGVFHGDADSEAIRPRIPK